jgi:hypothetical protein
VRGFSRKFCRRLPRSSFVEIQPQKGGGGKAAKSAQVIGVCNGFQILVEAGLLPGALMRNTSLKFVCREVKLKVANATRPSPETTCPVRSSVRRSPIMTATTSPTTGGNGTFALSRCGPASIANAFHSLGVEETTEAEVLDGTGMCWTGFCVIGLTLDELAEVARTHTERKVSVLRNLSAEEFREHMKRANDPIRRYIVNFTREKIFGAGAGHHSPIGGYLEAEDMVMVLDVNEAFKPWLIERERLFSAMDTIDCDGDKKRGFASDRVIFGASLVVKWLPGFTVRCSCLRTDPSCSAR